MCAKLKVFLFILPLFTVKTVASDIPPKFIGSWSAEIVAQPGFPWWSQIKYPVEIVMGNDGGYFVDQNGGRCDIVDFTYDGDLDSIVLKHCAQPKFSEAIEPYYLITIANGELVGEVRTYRLKFKWVGKRHEASLQLP